MTAMFAAILGAILSYGPGAQNLDVKQSRCLTDVVYYEARGEPALGQRLVADVVLHRVANSEAEGRPISICHAVYERGQFSWTRDRRRRVRDYVAYAQSARVAVAAQITPEPAARHALYFFTVRRHSPKWARSAHLLRVGRHYFATPANPGRMR